ncbi:MAG: peptidoglycan DD-metalloendopeptidase family protein [Butyrivibrio sp.]|nr:peptidoglycan DD-metalloendopeptidase family protein [Acetatifactor muris]MCM1559216.1 peptidoglycan DD-metalloendopeptidase family protein [Butyrivibrio sp.]
MKKRKAIMWGFAVGLLCALFFSDGTKQDASAITMSSITSDSIKDKEEQIRQAENEKEALRNGLSNLQTIKKDLEAQRANLKSYVAQLDSSLAQIEQNIRELSEKIAVKEEEIAEAEAELETALENEENQKEAMTDRIRMVYESGDPQMLDMLLKSSGFGDFLNKADYVERVVTYDRELWQDYKMVREYVELCKQGLELEKEILDEAKAGVEEEQQNLEALIDQKNRDIIAYETDIDNKEKAIKEYQEEIEAQENEIAMLEAQIAEDKKKILASSGIVLTYDGGAFKFPVASYTRVSDEYGPRIHPTLGIQQFHNGVDLASPKGTAIYAAYDGIVVAAAYSATMGNYVMIDHGSGLYTIYMHASVLYVEKDDIVVRGETIAAVGSTGRSTGPHLHFSVRLNGEYQSPWNYITK